MLPGPWKDGDRMSLSLQTQSRAWESEDQIWLAPTDACQLVFATGKTLTRYFEFVQNLVYTKDICYRNKFDILNLIVHKIFMWDHIDKKFPQIKTPFKPTSTVELRELGWEPQDSHKGLFKRKIGILELTTLMEFSFKHIYEECWLMSNFRP